MTDVTPPLDPEPADLAEDAPTPTHEMVAPFNRESAARQISARLTKKPSYSGDACAWKLFSCRARTYMDRCRIEATMLGNDARKTSDDADDVASWSDDNSLVFTLLLEMIDQDTTKGNTLSMLIMDKFPPEERKGDELWRYLEEDAEGLTIEQLNELKKEIRHVKLLENDSADVWKKKLVELKALWNRLPERVRGADQTLLCHVIVTRSCRRTCSATRT